MDDKKIRPRSYAHWAEAFAIFEKYEPSLAYADVAAEHDVIYAGGDPETFSEEDTNRLEELGWSPSEYGCWQRMV